MILRFDEYKDRRKVLLSKIRDFSKFANDASSSGNVSAYNSIAVVLGNLKKELLDLDRRYSK